MAKVKSKIHFRNERFFAHVLGEEKRKISCTPVVYEEPASHCGLGVFHMGRRRGHIWGPVSPRNLITAWRGTEVLRHLSVIEHGTLCGAYYYGDRSASESDKRTYATPIREKISSKTDREIWTKPIPAKIIRAILDGQKDGIWSPDLEPIVGEVRAGTINWRNEFNNFGIKHPSEIDRRAHIRKEIVSKYNKLLSSYAKGGSEYPIIRHCIMNKAEDILLTLIENGAGCCPDYVLVASAGMISSFSRIRFDTAIPEFDPCTNEGEKILEERGNREQIDYSAKWLVANRKSLRFSFSSKSQVEIDSSTFQGARKLLLWLFREYFSERKKAIPV